MLALSSWDSAPTGESRCPGLGPACAGASGEVAGLLRYARNDEPDGYAAPCGRGMGEAGRFRMGHACCTGPAQHYAAPIASVMLSP